MNTQHLKSIAKWAILCVILIGAGWYAWEHPELFRPLRRLTVGRLVLLLAIIVCAKLAQGMQLRTLAAALGVDLTFHEWFGLTACNGMYSYLAPGRAGLAAQALYLKKRHAFSFAHFASLVAALNAIQVACAGVLGLIGCAVCLALGPRPPMALVYAFLMLIGLSLGIMVAVFVGSRFIRHVPIRFVRSILTKAVEGFHMLRRNPAALFRVTVWRTAQLLLAATGFLVACGGVGLDVTAPQGMTMHFLASVGIFLPITPAGLGTVEGLVAGSARVWSLPVDTTLLAALVRRGAGIITIFVAGGLYSYYLFGKADEEQPTPEAQAEDEKLRAESADGGETADDGPVDR